MAREWVELRVHGVSGTPPEAMLASDRVVQVAGDELGRFFRRADADGRERAPVDGHTVEAYHWGALTAGSWQQGLWLLLAPFGFVNTAQYTLPRPTAPAARAAYRVCGAGLRVVGLAITLLFVLTAMVISVDLWAWQRSGATSVLTYALAFTAPLALLGVYSWLARATPDPDLRPDPVAAGPAAQHDSELVRPAFFDGDPDAPGLKLLHLAAGVALVALLAAGPEALRAGGTRAPFWVALGVVVAIAVVVAFLGDPSSRIDWDHRDRDARARRVSRWLGRCAMALAAVAVAVSAVAFCLAPPDPRAVVAGAGTLAHFPAVDWAAYAVMGLALTGIAVVAVGNVVLAVVQRNETAAAERPFRAYLRGMGATCLASIATFLGVGYCGAFTTVVAAGLQTVRPDGGPAAVSTPELMSRAVYAWGWTVLVVAALVLVVLVCRRRAVRLLLPGVVSDAGHLVPHRWLRRIAAARWVARLKQRVPLLVAVFTVLGIGLSVAVLVEVAPIVEVPVGQWPRLGSEASDAAWVLSGSDTYPQAGSAARTFLVAAGTLALTLLATALVALGRSAILGESARRGANVVWDVVSFWPRAVHPFVPATYAQRVVVDLERRLRWHRAAGRRVVVCAHSQGSLLAFAVMLRLARTAEQPGADGRAPTPAPGPAGGVGLLTFGSQLQVLFSRGFPAYVNLPAIQGLFATLGGAWRNLYRDTDPLAGPVLSWHHHTASGTWVVTGADGRPGLVRDESSDDEAPGREEFGPDWRLLDPPVVPSSPPPREDRIDTHALLPLRGHSGYWLDEAWAPALDEVRTALDAPDDARPSEAEKSASRTDATPSAPAVVP